MDAEAINDATYMKCKSCGKPYMQSHLFRTEEDIIYKFGKVKTKEKKNKTGEILGYLVVPCAHWKVKKNKKNFVRNQEWFDEVVEPQINQIKQSGLTEVNIFLSHRHDFHEVVKKTMHISLFPPEHLNQNNWDEHLPLAGKVFTEIFKEIGDVKLNVYMSSAQGLNFAVSNWLSLIFISEHMFGKKPPFKISSVELFFITEHKYIRINSLWNHSKETLEVISQTIANTWATETNEEE